MTYKDGGIDEVEDEEGNNDKHLQIAYWDTTTESHSVPSVALYGGCIGYILILQRDILRHSRLSNFTRCLKHVNAGGRLDCKVPALNNYI